MKHETVTSNRRKSNMMRVSLLGAFLVAAAATWFFTAGVGKAADITVYKSPQCGCCSKWAAHLRASGYSVETKEIEDMDAIKKKLKVPENLQACHTAVVDGYVVEGHVPAQDIKRLLAERPDASGLAVPGMPMGSPGMESDNTDQFNVMLFKSDGSEDVYARR